MNKNILSENQIINFSKILDPNRKIKFEAQTSGIQLYAGMKIVTNEISFDLCGKEPQNGMDIYISEDGKLYCEQPDNYWCHFIGNVKLNPTFYFYKAYSIYIVSIEKDRKPVKCSVEIMG